MTQKPFFNENLVILDDQSWIWNFITAAFAEAGSPYLRLPSSVPIRQSWSRFKSSPKIIIHWESKSRSGGAIIEEIIDIAPGFAVSEQIIVLSTNPTHEDVVYFSELGVRRIIKLRQREKELLQAKNELLFHLSNSLDKDEVETGWRKLHLMFDQVKPEQVNDEFIAKCEQQLRALKPDELTARYLDGLAKLASFKNEDESAVRTWYLALEKNPNHYRSYAGLIQHHREQGRLQEAMALMQKMQELNRDNISRLVSMGEVQMELRDLPRAEFYFKSALDRDPYCSVALNGLAEIRFNQGNLEESRKLLARSQLAYKTAANLNMQGIDLVKQNSYQEALDHYTKAQYVLPNQDKGPLLFYNIALCYSRWGKFPMAKEFLQIALIKDPTYDKAIKLLETVEKKLPQEEKEEVEEQTRHNPKAS